ncbi:MAG TPA: GNAT family N-acetyltransferase [Candidatus Acidoferrales bacterium]|nr:GNAT family N-acetyltransferase [Candidatus Acidoferrales bacterium]
MSRPEYAIRRATIADVAVIAHHRAAMFRDMGELDDAEMPALEAATREYLTHALPAEEYLGWVVDTADQVVAGGGVLLRPLLPRPGAPRGGAEAYVLNVYTEPEHRRRGLARQLMQAILAWCEARAVARVTLHASDDGRALYESLGFAQTNEMRRDKAR